MPYRQSLSVATAQNPERLLTIWRQERAYRIGKVLCYSCLILFGLATIADFFWSDFFVILTDFVLIFGGLISLYWLNIKQRPTHFWWPLYVSFWISTIPSLFSTGGIASPFFGLNLVIFYVFGAVFDAKHSPRRYFLFALAHIPIFLSIEYFQPLSLSERLSPNFIAIIYAMFLVTLYICISAVLRTEQELAFEFSAHYRNLGKTEEELKKHELQLKEAQTIANVGSWEWDIERDHITWSDELFKIYEVDKKTFIPSFQSYLTILTPEVRKQTENILSDAILYRDNFSFENSFETSRGVRFVSTRGRISRDSEGKAVKMFGTSQDITDRKHIEALLTDARNDLEKRVEERTLQLEESLQREKEAKKFAENASQAKMQFLANMSHEIRTPMNSILGFSDLLATDGLSPEETKEYLSRIRANGKQLLHLIDDILDLSKFEAGRIPIQKSAFSLRTLTNEVVNSFALNLQNKGLALDLDFQEGPSPQIFTDPARVSQILINLLSNSVKFSKNGTILICVHYDKLENNRLSITIDVKDSGIGISTENQKNLFKPFSQGDTSVARRFGGSGLGLALSKHIAEALNGSLQLIESQPGIGSHFSFQFEVDQIEERLEEAVTTVKHQNASDNSPLKGKKILLVEDSSDNAFLICHYLKSFTVEVDVANDGAQAIEKFTQKPYDCILMDIQMPGMDGLEATRKIRDLGYKKPIIALTAHALPTEAERSLEAGCDLHLTKPISKAILLESLSAQLRFT